MRRGSILGALLILAKRSIQVASGTVLVCSSPAANNYLHKLLATIHSVSVADPGEFQMKPPFVL